MGVIPTRHTQEVEVSAQEQADLNQINIDTYKDPMYQELIKIQGDISEKELALAKTQDVTMDLIDSLDLCYVPISEDVHLNLELLSRGYSNAIMEEFCIKQISNKEGGCRTYRTQQLEDKCFKKLHEKFPKWVKIYETKSNYRNLFAPTLSAGY